MSAGICIMNKNAIALAADSAVTIGQHLAIHNSANKLFALSKVAPIGVIIYSNAELMGVPMELIIKQYKSELRNKVFPNLSDYVTDFLKFLILKSDLFHFPTNEKSYVTNVYVDLLNGLNGDYQLSIKRKINEVKRDLIAEELQEIQVETVKATLMFVDQLAVIPNLELHDYIKDTYGGEIRQYISAHFPWIGKPLLTELVEKICFVYNKDFMRNGYVGLSITVQKHIQHCHLNGVRRIINTPDTICKSRIKLSCGSKCSDEEICTTTSWVCNMFTELRIDNINKEIRNRSWCEILRHIPLIQSLRKLHIKGLNYISFRMKYCKITSETVTTTIAKFLDNRLNPEVLFRVSLT